MPGTEGGRLEPPLFLHDAGYSSSKSSISLLNANKHLMTGPGRNLSFCFPRISQCLKHLVLRETKLTVFRGTSL